MTFLGSCDINKKRAIKTEKIIFLIKSDREQEAIDYLYQTVWPGVRAYITKNSGDAEQAKDIFHDGILNVLMRIKKKKLEITTDLSGYLFISCKNLWVRKTLRDKKIVLSEDTLKYEGVEDDYSADSLKNEKVQLLNKKMAEIGEKCKELLRLTYYEGLSLKEAAVYLGYSSAGTAKSTQHRCKEKLRLAFQKSRAYNELKS